MKGSAFELREDLLDPSSGKHYEGAFTQGNSYLQLRGSFEEGLACAPQNEKYWRLPANVTLEKQRSPRSKCGTYVPGIMGSHPLLNEEVVNLPNPLIFRVSCSLEALDMDLCEIKDYSRVLNLRNGVLARRFIWKTNSGAALECSYERFASRARKNLIVQKMTYKCIEGKAELRFLNDIDENVTTNGYSHFASNQKTPRGNGALVTVETDKKEKVWLETRAFGERLRFREGTANISLAPSEEITVIKISGIMTSRDTDALLGPEQLSHLIEEAGSDYAALKAENDLAWEKLWENSGVEIEGDEEAQLALNFSVYHLLRGACENDDRVAICAKGFAGEAYFGHFFWDTEVYLLPFFLYTNPRVAKNLVSFRVNTLKGAMENARRYGCRGARYPWESSVSGTEQCPNWQYADHEIHITADVVYGLWHYYEATGDFDFIAKAAPVFVETARYWFDRVEFRSDGEVHLNGVMGPDEYTCLSSDNAYTNAMVRHSLEKTLELLSLLKERKPDSIKDLNIDEAFRSKALEIIQKIPVPVTSDGVIIQCREFAQMEEPRFDLTWTDRSKCFGTQVPQEKLYRVKALKQADALMLPFLFPKNYSAEEVKKNLAYYLPYTTHDSSLSYIIHAILLARCQKAEEGFELMRKALKIDLSDYHGGASEGIHIANCGGIWQAVVLGFAGFTPGEEKPVFHPNLPRNWTALRFHIVYRGQKYQVEITPSSVKITPRGEN